MGDLFLLLVCVALPLILIAPFPQSARAIVSVAGLAAVLVILYRWNTGPHDPRPFFVLAVGVGCLLRALLEASLFGWRLLKRRAAAHG